MSMMERERMKEREIKKAVRDGYARIAKQASSCCSSASPCCGTALSEELSKRIGYTDEEIMAAPPESNLGLGCGNPVAIASLSEGQRVLDLGSGAGFDCFLASRRVGEKGEVIGVDMTTEMVERARANARKGSYRNVDFRQGELENLPVADNFVDVVISNCVINLVPNKWRVFKEAFRVLRSGGQLAVSDIVLKKELPEFVKSSTQAYIGCLAGAIMKDDYIEIIKSTGFVDVEVKDESAFPIECLMADGAGAVKDMPVTPDEIREISSSVLSIKISAVKP